MTTLFIFGLACVDRHRCVMKPPWSSWLNTAIHLLVPTVSAFLCFLWTVIRETDTLGGQYAFLVYTAQVLFFFPAGRLLPQIEATVHGLLGASFGLAWSCMTIAVSAACARTYGTESAPTRAVLAIGLACLAFISGLVRSSATMLTAASRIALFFPIFLLTSTDAIKATSVNSRFFLDQFLVACFASAFALVASICLVQAHRSPFAELGDLFETALGLIADSFPNSLVMLLGNVDMSAHGTASPASVSHEKSTRQLRQAIKQMSTIHARVRLIVFRSRVSPSALGDLVDQLGKISRNPLLSSTSHIPGERIQSALRRHNAFGGSRSQSGPETPRLSLRLQQLTGGSGGWQGHRTSAPRSPLSASRLHAALSGLDGGGGSSGASEITLSVQKDNGIQSACRGAADSVVQVLGTIRLQLAEVCGWKTPNGLSSVTTDRASTHEELAKALGGLQSTLSTLLESSHTSLGKDHWSSLERSRGEEVTRGSVHAALEDRNRDRFRLAFYLVALVDLIKDIQQLAAIVARVAASSAHQVWRLPLALSPSTWKVSDLFATQPATERSEDADDATDDSTSSLDPGNDDRPTPQDLDFVHASLQEGKTSNVDGRMLGGRLQRAWRTMWDDVSILRMRVALSRLIHFLRHSPHILFAVKMAFGVSLLALPAFLAPGSRARWWYSESRGAWAVVSYMYVLDVHTGAILRTGFFRLIGTFIGAVAGYVCIEIAHRNPYGLVALATGCSLPISWGIVTGHLPQMFTVIGITLPPLLFLDYLDLNNGQGEFTLAWLRFVDIAIGIGAAVLVGTMVWPDHARVRYFVAFFGTMNRVVEYYLIMSRENLRSSLLYQAKGKDYDLLESSVRRDVQICRNLVEVQRREISLLPRPIKLYSEAIDRVERLLEAFSEIRVLRFSVPREATVLDVLPLRRELVSAILVNLWAIAQAFRSRSALPQFLPSPRGSLDSLMEVTDEHARTIRAQSRDALHSSQGAKAARQEMSVLYGMAENEALGEVCDIIDELVAVARTLFGSRTFLSAAQLDAGQGIDAHARP